MHTYRKYGFIHDKLEIKILILFILRRIPEPITLAELTELAMCDDGISYFDFAESVTELVKTKHLTYDSGKYALTNKGKRNGEATENSLPYSVRKKVEGGTSSYRATLMRSAMIKTFHKTNPDNSCTVTLSLSDGVGDIINIEMLAANEKQALALERGFRKNAELAYNALVETLLG